MTPDHIPYYPDFKHRAAIERLQKTLDDSPYAAAAMACGFSFGEIHASVPEDFGGGLICISLEFQCRCGRRERFHTVRSKVDGIDLARELYEFGSFSARHLIGDGYSEADAHRIEQRFEKIVAVLNRENDEQELREHPSRAALEPVDVGTRKSRRPDRVRAPEADPKPGRRRPERSG